MPIPSPNSPAAPMPAAAVEASTMRLRFIVISVSLLTCLSSMTLWGADLCQL